MAGGLFDVENKFWQFLNKITDLFLLSLLAFAFSIPLVTIGPALCGFYYAAMRIHENTDGGLWTDFWHGFISSFFVGTLLWIIQVLISALLVYNMYLSFHMSGISAVVAAVSLVVLAMVTITSFFAYPIASRYHFSVAKIIKDSLFFTVRFLPYGFSLLVLLVGGIYLAIRIPYTTALIPAFLGYQIARVCVWVFHKFEQKGA